MSKRVGCPHCNYRGYMKFSFFGDSDNKESVTITPCPQCKDARGYYAYVRNKYSKNKDESILEIIKEPIGKILDFVAFKEKRTKGK